jgi:hypothetical protein
MPIEIQDPRRLPADFCIFFCWQDHLPKKLHRFLIRDALDRAISRVQDDLPEGVECTLRRDEATDNRAGSIDIANTILEKLNSSTVVVGDITPVLKDLDKNWFYPNPNVMVEIGYAAKTLGWSRVVCLFNEVACKAEQLPFDIRHRRVTGFSCEDLTQRKRALVDLEGVLIAAIRAIIQEVGRGVIDPSIGDAALRHQRDLRFLRDVMCCIHRRTLDRFIERGHSYQVHYDCIYFWHDFDAIVCSCDFRFYDKDLQRLALELHRVWGETIHHGSYAFAPGSAPGSLVLKPRHLWNESYEETVRAMEASYIALPQVLNAFLDHVHEHFREIDMDETDAVAWERNLRYIDGSALQNIRSESNDEGAEESE